ncbi:MAG: hypothetical protein ACE141_06455 [Bryobacteraceae bacterium]
MLYFPQLESGASVQYPFVKRRVYRTVTNTLADGRTVKLLDLGATMTAWDLTFSSLASSERAQLEEFFNAVEGRLSSFTMLDPTENLLLWSGDLNASVWAADPQLSVTGGVADPDNGTFAFRLSNAGALSQSIRQTLDAPSWFRYCFSVYARSSTAGRLTLFRSAGSEEEAEECALSPAWRRLMLTGAGSGTQESVVFGLRLANGASADVYGLQVEAQPAPSAYRKTTSRNGIYAAARFDDDVLSITSHGPEQHACTVRIVAPAAS